MVDQNAVIAGYCGTIQELVLLFKGPQFPPEMFKMFVFHVIVNKLIRNQLLPGGKSQSSEKLQNLFLDWYAEFYQRLALQFPTLGFKEMAMAYCMNTTARFSGKLLIPEEPEGTNEEKLA